MAVTIRPARTADQPEIERIIRLVQINPTQLDWRRFLVAEDNGRVVAIGQIKAHGDGSRELASIAVVPDRQGQGLGAAIIRALLECESGPLYLTCAGWNENYYTRFGFRTLQFEEMPPYFRRIYRLAGLFMPLAGLIRRRKVELRVMKREAGPLA